MLNNLDSVLLNKDYRGKRILVGAKGILREEEIDRNINISGYKFIEQNGIYVWCINLDTRHKHIEIVGSKGFKLLDSIRYM